MLGHRRTEGCCFHTFWLAAQSRINWGVECWLTSMCRSPPRLVAFSAFRQPYSGWEEGGGFSPPPPQVFIVPLLNAATLKAHTWWICTNIHCAKKLPGQVRSGHQWRFVNPTSEKFAIPPELELFMGRFIFFKFHKDTMTCNLYIS